MIKRLTKNLSLKTTALLRYCFATCHCEGSARSNLCRTFALLLFCAFLLMMALPAFAVSPDNGFNPDANSTVYSIAMQSDGKILIGGWFTTIGGVSRNYIARLNTDGTVDSAFNPDANGGINSIAIQSDGKILIGGWFTTIGGVSRNYIARLNTDGTVDSAFNPDANGGINSIAIQPDGKILISGWFTTVGGVSRNYIARLNTDGTVDSAFNPDANGGINSIAIQPDGKILISGWFITVGGVSRNYIARLNTDGTVDSAFNPDANGGINSIAIQPDGKIIIGGDFTSVGGYIRNHIARLNPNGTVDSALNTVGELDTIFNSPNGFVLYNGPANGQDNGNAVAIQPDGKIVIVGSSSDSNGADLLVMRYNSDGTPDTSFNGNGIVTYRGGTNTYDAGRAVAIQTDGKIVVVGNNVILRYNDDGTLDTTFNGNGIILSGGHAIAIQSDGKIVVVGNTLYGNSEDVPVRRYNSNGTLDISFTMPGSSYSASTSSGNIVAIQQDGKIVITGRHYHHSGSNNDDELLVFRYNSDGTLDSSFNGTGVASYRGYLWANAVAIQPDGKIVVVGDMGQSTLYLFRYNSDGTLDPSFNGNGLRTFGITGNEIFYAVAIQSDGKIIIVGRSVYDNSVVTVLRLNSDGTFDCTFGKGGMGTYNFGNNNVGCAVAIQPDGKIVVAGINSVGFGKPGYPNEDLLVFRLRTSPVGTITINSDAIFTNSTSVTLTLSCTDTNNCVEMQFSNDNTTWSAPDAFGTTKQWTLTEGDGTKTVYVRFKDITGNWSSAYSDTIVLDTTVSAPSNIEANQNGNKGELQVTWTKPTDSDFNHIHIYRSTTSGVLGSLIADNQTGIKYVDTGLGSETTYYYTVRAVDNAGNESTNTTQYSAKTLDSQPPAVPSNITATDAGTGGTINLSWTNPADSDFSHIHIYRSTTSGTLGSLIYDNVTGTSKSDTGLTNGTTYYYTIRAVDISDNETTNTAQVSATPTAPDITAPGTVLGVVISDPATGGVLNVSWTNPADSDFAKVRIYRSTIEGQLGSLVHEVTGTSVSDTGLTSNTTYYYTFRTVDTVGNESTDATQYSGMPTDTVAPNPVTEFTVTLLSGGKVRLDWIRSSSEDINYYNIYYDNGTGTIDYSTAIASIQHPTVTWTSDALTVGTRYQFAIRAEDTSLNKETNTNVISVVLVTDPNAGDVSASIKVPQTGKKVCGNMVTVMAELIMGTVADTQEIRLQYKTVASGTWSDILSTDPAKFPNPDTTSPYFVHWDVTTLADGDYNLRAVATSNALVTDSNPSYITITVDSVNCSSQETTNAGGEKTKAEDVSKNASSNSVMAGSTGVTTVSLSEGALDADTKINITESDPATKATLVPSGYSNGSSFNEIGFESGQTTLANNKKATVEMPYKDNDNNGIVDGTSVKVYDLQVCDYNSGTGKWTCLDPLVDTDKKTVKAKTEKFSLFGLLMPPKPVGAEWNLLSVPLQPSPNTPSAVFGSVTNYTNYVLWWNPSIGDYQIVSTIETGKSYWVWGNGKNLGTVSGTETPNANFSISIKKGWNMIGHPFRYKVNVSDLWIYYEGNYYTIQDAETNGWVVATIYSYKDGAYQFSNASDGGAIEAWKGYWMLSDIDCTLIVPPTPAQ